MYIHRALEEKHIRCNAYQLYSFLFLSISETIKDLSTLHVLTTCHVFYFNEFYDKCKQMRFQSYLQR